MLPRAFPTAAAAVLLALVSGFHFASPAAAVQDQRAAFGEVLDQTSRWMAAGRWDKARAALLEALAEHGDADYVLIALPGVQEDLERCAFWSKHERPEPEDVVAGELVSYNERSGEIKLRYRLGDEQRKELSKKKSRGTPKLPFESDFEQSDAFFVHPLVFQGPYSIEIRCGPIGRHQPRVIACMDENGAYMLLPDSPARILRFSDGTWHDEELSTNALDVNEPLRVTVDVRGAKLSLAAGGRQLVSCRKDKDSWGQVGFIDFPDVEEIVISGKAETAWIEGLVDAAIERARAEFDEGYDPLAGLPQRLRERVQQTAVEEEGWFDGFPGIDSPGRVAQIERIGEYFEKGDWESALRYVDALDGDEIAALRSWCRALFQLMGGKVAAAQADLDALAQLEPGFWPARQLAANLRVETRTRAEALAEARALAQELPDEPRARELLVQAHMLSGMTDEAQATLDRALADGLLSAGLDSWRRVLARAVRGPEWAKPFEYASSHYEVRSDISRQLCFEAGQALEAMYKKLDVNFRRIDQDKKKGRFRVFLFSGRSGYFTYAADVFNSSPEQTAGLYSPVLKQLLIWNLPERDQMMRTIRHEGFHQVFDQIVDHAPRWLNEGLAEYFELSRRVGGKWKDGLAHPEHLYTLAQNELVPLDEFLTLGAHAFYADARLNYAQSWALVHFLLESGPGERERFDALLDALIAGEETNAALARVFPTDDLRDLEKRLREHIRGIEE